MDSIFYDFPYLSVLTFLPLIGALMLYLVPSFKPSSDPHGDRARMWSFFITGLAFALSVIMFTEFVPTETGYQFVESAPWIPGFGISYTIGVDGISVLLVLLTTFLMPIIVLASPSIHSRPRGYLASMLVLQTAMIGTLVSLDVFLFYVYWELMLAPMYFIIGIWGGKRRIYATLKFVLYTVFGSLLMLVAIFYVVWRFYEQRGEISFLLDELVMFTNLTLKEEIWLFAAFALAFGIKVPIFPFHTWLPDAHVEAPTGGSVILAGVLLKMGLYGFIRFACPLFPLGAQVFAPYLIALAVIGIVYGALVAWAQDDIKKLVAYSSVSHLGYCVLGFFAGITLAGTSSTEPPNSVAAVGSVYQMLNHGISTGALFLLVGVLYDRRHTRLIAEYGGLAAKVPVFAFLFLVFTLSSIALPLTNGFIGEFLILAGSFLAYPGVTTIALLGVVLGAVYMLTLYMKTMYGELDEAKNGELSDCTGREIALFIPLLVMVFWMGLFPQKFLSTIEPTMNGYMKMVQERGQARRAFDAALNGQDKDLPATSAVASAARSSNS
ncbi:MAG: NADH-quinone oxidoreductase subunit M [Deltaproteobacteria bacterium]|nr:NADH-quinone oxidoreductase subunit M [Deltaproteobacteria bacterium]